MHQVKWIWLLCLLMLPISGVAGDSDLQLWSAYNWKFAKKGKTSYNLYLEGRSREDGEIAFGYFVGPTVRHKVSPHLTLGAAGKMIWLKIGDPARFARWQRSELEFTYNFKIGSRIRFDHRNRHEYFWRQDNSDFQRYRSRLRFNLPLQNSLFSNLTFSNEFIYDTRRNHFELNRLVPLSLSFKLNKRFKLSTYYMWEHKRSSDSDNHILGTFLSF